MKQNKFVLETKSGEVVIFTTTATENEFKQAFNIAVGTITTLPLENHLYAILKAHSYYVDFEYANSTIFQEA